VLCWWWAQLEAADLSQVQTYVVEMELGPEPDMGRVGSETMIPILEADIHEVNNQCTPNRLELLTR